MVQLCTCFSNISLSVFEQAGPIIISATAVGILYTRSMGMVYYAVGAICCSLSAKAIKMFIRQPRPPTFVEGLVKKSYGMPSTHSASISYLATYTLLSSFLLPFDPSANNPMNAQFVPIVAIPSAIGVTMSRVWLGYHTWSQVLAGVSYGIGFASIWFELWRTGLNTALLPFETVINYWIDSMLQSYSGQSGDEVFKM